jgi:hypothetical protein
MTESVNNELERTGRKTIVDYYIHDSVHRDSSILIRSNEMQQYAGVYLLQNYSTCFGFLSHPSSGVHQSVTAASGTGHITYQIHNLPPA